MSTSLVTFAEVASEEAAHVSPYLYGAVTLALLLFLLAATYAFRSVGTRHR